jgi:N-acetyl sugar amidotransferase
VLTYCTRCVMPSTKPDLLFDEDGVCNACRNYENRNQIDWDARKKELLQLVERYGSRNGKNWDCVIPVSGGKDSTYQVIRVLQMGLNPLCVTSTTCDLTDIGRENIKNIQNLGVDYVEFTTNRQVRRKLNRIGLTMVGDISWPEHVSIFTIPVQVAVQYNIPLIIWGENSQNEYGGPAAAAENNVLNRRWLEEFGGLLGLRVSDLVGMEGIEARHLLPYSYPSDEDLQRVGVTGLFLGYYMPWDGLANTLVAQAHGFNSYHKPVEGAMLNYENLDNYHTGIHDYFKFLKFGFGRATDHACLHIRRDRISREDGLEIVKRHDGKFPASYLGKSLEDILVPLDMTVDEFTKVCDRFTNKKIFKTDAQGKLVKDKHGNLTKLNADNVPAASREHALQSS